MKDGRLEKLADMARNRGLKLVRSRVRTAGKRGFGKAGLTDFSGEPVFGMDLEGPNAAPEALEDYLRTLEAKDWGASLGAADRQAKKRSKAPGTSDGGPTPALEASAPRPPARTEPEPIIREAAPEDAAILVELVSELGSEITEKQVRTNLAELEKSGGTPLVAALGGKVVGLVGVGRRVAVHRPAPLGRITVLVVSSTMRGRGIGRMLVEAAEQWMKKRGCGIVEVTSNDRRAEAHAFYRHMGYERTSIRFARTL